MVATDKIIKDFKTALSDFVRTASDDPRLGPLHISLYVAILDFYNEADGAVPVSVFSKMLMKRSKISSPDTYHRYIRELHNYGYIHYIPSYNPLLGSLIYPLKLERK